MKNLIALSDKKITLVRNEYLKTEGSIDTNLYFVESGSLRIFVTDGSEEQNIRLGYHGNFIASLDSFLTGNSSELCIQALRKTVIRVITRKQINVFLENEINKGLWIKTLEELILQQMQRETDIHQSSPKERYLRVLARSP